MQTSTVLSTASSVVFSCALIVLTTVTAFPTSSFAAIDAEGRQRVEFAWEKSRTYIMACLVTDECGLSKDETQLAFQILANDSHYSAASLKFVEESEAQFASVDGDAHRLMLTGLTPTSLIYINADRIADVPVETMIGLFAHELVHHLGIVDDASRRPDQFGTRIAAIARRYIVPLNLGLRDTTALVFNYPQPIQIEFLKLFPKGLFPTIYLSQKRQTVVQELHMMPKETRNICSSSNEVLWSSHAKVTSIAKDSNELTASFQFVSRCFDAAPPGKLQEAITYGATKIEFDSTKNDELGVATVSFSKTPIDAVASASIDVKLTAMPTVIKAGQDLVVTALVEAPKPQDVVGCGALIGADTWRESAAENPLSLITMDCRITSQSGNTKFAVEFKQPISKHAPDQLKLKVQAVGLRLLSGGFIRGIPERATTVTVENPAMGSRAIPDAKVTASGATPLNPSKYPNSFYIRRGETFSLDILFSSSTTTSLVDGYVNYQAQMFDKQIMTGTASVTKNGAGCARDLGRTAGGTGIRCGSPIDLLNIAPGKEAVMWTPTRIVILTDDLQFLSVDVSGDELAVVSTEKAP